MRLKKGRVTCTGYVLLLCQSNQMFPWKNVFLFFFESSYVDKREWIPERVWLSISGRYPGFHEWLNWRGGHVEPCNITDVELDRRSRCISENTRGLVVQSVNESSWGPGTGMFGYTPCFFSLFISLSSLISFREFFFLAGPETGAAKHAAPFGLTLKTFNMHLNTPFKDQL